MFKKIYTKHILWFLCFFLFIEPGYSNNLDHNTNAAINIDLTSPAVDTIKPFIYGGFIEFIGQTINGKYGLWAQEIEFRGFEVPDTNSHCVSKGWIPLVKANAVCTMEQDTARANRNGLYSQKIQVTSYQDGLAGITQSEIRIKSRESYDITLYLKGSEIEGSVTVWILEDTTDWRVCDSVTFNRISETWTKFCDVFKPGTSVQNGFIAITIEEEGSIWIDEVSLMPQSSVDGVKKDYVEHTRELKPNIMRYPGGSFADGTGNHWINGTGDTDQRPPNWDNYFEAWQRLDFGTDEFVQFCRNTDMEPQITVNFGSGTPVEAANWVEYVNGDINTAYGRLRAKNGHPEPYKILYWEIGNEQYRELAIGHTSAENYANQFINYKDQMKSVDPNIKIIANGCRYKQSWNDTLLTIAGDAMDYISLHLTCPDLSDNASGHTDEEIYQAVVAAPLKHKITLDQLKRMIDTSTSGNVRIALTELWMTFGRNPLYAHHGNTLETALYIAGMLNLLQKSSHIVDIANWTTAGKIKFSSYTSKYYKTAAFHVLSLYSSYSGNVPVISAVDCPTYRSPRVGSFAAMDSVPYLDVSVTRNNEKIFINTVNRSLEDITASLYITGETIEPDAVIRTVNGPDYLSSNNQPPHNQVSISESYLNHIEQNFVYTFPSHSITGIELRVKSSGLDNHKLIVTKYVLSNAYPNPFNSYTSINYQLPAIANVNLEIFDVQGQKVRTLVNSKQTAKLHTILWHGKNDLGEYAGSGVYFYRLKISNRIPVTKKLLLLK